jgi:hypothetical protein
MGLTSSLVSNPIQLPSSMPSAFHQCRHVPPLSFAHRPATYLPGYQPRKKNDHQETSALNPRST